MNGLSFWRGAALCLVQLCLLVAVTLFIGCPQAAVCTHLETRCAGDVVQICDARGRWEQVMDCHSVMDPQNFIWTCQETEQEHACLPRE